MSLKDLFSELRRKIALVLSRCVVSLVDDTKGIQSVQAEVLAGEVIDNIERLQNYGFTSVPLKNSEGLVGFIGANREHGIIFVLDDSIYRLKNLAPGEVAIYTNEADKIHFKNGKIIDIISTGTINITAPTINLTSTTMTIKTTTLDINQ